MPESFRRVSEGPKSNTKSGIETTAVLASLIHTIRFEQLNNILGLKWLE